MARINVLHIVAAVLIVVVLGFAYTNLTGNITGGNSTGNNTGNNTGNTTLDAFAQCLTEKGIVMYGTDTCPACKSQKALFGSSFQYVNYTNCLDNYDFCVGKGISSIPSWDINGQFSVGVQTIQQLSELSGCSLEV